MWLKNFVTNDAKSERYRKLEEGQEGKEKGEKVQKRELERNKEVKEVNSPEKMRGWKGGQE